MQNIVNCEHLTAKKNKKTKTATTGWNWQINHHHVVNTWDGAHGIVDRGERSIGKILYEEIDHDQSPNR